MPTVIIVIRTALEGVKKEIVSSGGTGPSFCRNVTSQAVADVLATLTMPIVLTADRILCRSDADALKAILKEYDPRRPRRKKPPFGIDANDTI